MIRLTTWSELRAIGNSPPARASIMVPFLGYLILFNKHVVDAFAFKCIDLPCQQGVLFPKLYYLYFGLTFFGLGSFLYQLRCDSRIRRFANAEDYVLSVKEIATNGELCRHQQITDDLTGGSAATTDFLTAQLADPEFASQLKLDILTQHYRALDNARSISRFFVLIAYVAGFVLMAIPAATTFIEVTESLIDR